MNNHDQALSFANPRLLAALYYGLLSVIGTVLINGFLTLLEIREIIPLYETIVLGMVIAATTGAVFGKQIICCPKPYKYKTFFIGFSMVLMSLPLFALGLLFFITDSDAHLFSITTFRDLAYDYIVVLAYSYVLFGFFLAIGSGFASIYLRGWLVYAILHTDKRKNMHLPRFVAAHAKAMSLQKKPVIRKKT